MKADKKIHTSKNDIQSKCLVLNCRSLDNFGNYEGMMPLYLFIRIMPIKLRTQKS